MKKSVCFSLFLIMLLISSSVSASDSSTIFEKLDEDDNESLSREELLKSDLVVVKGSNGKKTVIHRDMVKDAEAAAITTEQKHSFFEDIDTDKNGFINRKEWSRASPDGFIIFKF